MSIMEKKDYFLLLVSVLCFTFSSCNDNNMAKAVDGTWATSLNLKDEYGTPFTQNQTYKFTYIKDNAKDGGILKEYTKTTITEEMDDIEVTYTVSSSIKGEYEFIFGDLYITYNLNSLDVKVSDVDWKASDDMDFATKIDLLNMAFQGEELINEKELSKEIRKNSYKNFYEDYQSMNENDDNGCSYQEVKVGNDVLSFITKDSGRITLHKVSSK